MGTCADDCCPRSVILLRTLAVFAWFCVITSILLLDIPDARAGCGLAKRVRFEPPAGATLDPGGAVFAFVMPEAFPQKGHVSPPKPRILVNGKVPSSIQDLTTARPNTRVFRVGISAAQGRRKQVSVEVAVHGEIHKANYTIRRKARRPSRSPGKIMTAEYSYAVGDPGSDAFILEVQPRASAYRVVVGNQTWVVPDQRRHRRQPAKDSGYIITGFLGCASYIVPTTSPFATKITALLNAGKNGPSFPSMCATTTNDDGSASVQCSNHRSFRFGGKVFER